MIATNDYRDNRKIGMATSYGYTETGATGYTECNPETAGGYGAEAKADEQVIASFVGLDLREERNFKVRSWPPPRCGMVRPVEVKRKSWNRGRSWDRKLRSHG